MVGQFLTVVHTYVFLLKDLESKFWSGQSFPVILDLQRSK
jgi:hypothetical protein